MFIPLVAGMFLGPCPTSQLNLASLRIEYSCSLKDYLPVLLGWALHQAFPRLLENKGTSDT